MRYRMYTAALVAAIPLLAVLAHQSTAIPKKNAPPPVLIRMPEYHVMTPLPDGRLVGVFDQGGEAFARYSSDGGRTWLPPERLFAHPKGLGGFGLHNLVADKNGELHLIYTGHTAGKTIYETRYDVYHFGSTNGRKSWKPA